MDKKQRQEREQREYRESSTAAVGRAIHRILRLPLTGEVERGGSDSASTLLSSLHRVTDALLSEPQQAAVAWLRELVWIRLFLRSLRAARRGCAVRCSRCSRSPHPRSVFGWKESLLRAHQNWATSQHSNARDALCVPESNLRFTLRRSLLVLGWFLYSSLAAPIAGWVCGWAVGAFFHLQIRSLSSNSHYVRKIKNSFIIILV